MKEAPNKYKYCSKHFVSLCWFDQEIEKASVGERWRQYAVSGFVMSFKKKWYLATAGHIIHGLETNHRNNRSRITSICLIDHGGVEAKNTMEVPFNIFDFKRFHIYDDDRGIDFGMIEILPFWRKTMEANGVRAIDEYHWDRDDKFQVQQRIVYGIPRMYSKALVDIRNEREPMKGFARITIMPIKMLPNRKRDEKEFPRFRAKPKDPKITSYTHVDGFSGGPVIAFGKKRKDGTVPYQFIGMQHAWNKDDQFLIGTPLKTIGTLFRKHLRGKTI